MQTWTSWLLTTQLNFSARINVYIFYNDVFSALTDYLDKGSLRRIGYTCTLYTSVTSILLAFINTSMIWKCVYFQE